MSDDILGSLSSYFPKGVAEDEEEKIKELFKVFQRDFCDEANPLCIDGQGFSIKKIKYALSAFDSLPDHFNNYYETFVHIITRVNKSPRKSSDSREFRPERANRVHWMRPIIENSSDWRIKRFKFVESNGVVREYYWYENFDYMVVTQPISSGILLITGFCVDGSNKSHYQNKYVKRVK